MAKGANDFETQLARLRAVVEQLESGDLPLEKSVALFKEGQALVKACGEQLKKARHEIVLAGGGELPDLETLSELPDMDDVDDGGEDL